MNKRSLTLIMATAALVLCLLSPFAGAVTIGYTADSGGESVSISENYDVDNTVTVKETTDISFGNLQVDQERTAEGTGESDLEQTIIGKTADGTQYTAENVILSEGTINAKTYTSATGNTLGVAQTVYATGDAELLLEGEEGGNMAGQSAIVENGRLNSKQTLDIGNIVRASLDASIWGDFGAAIAMAEDADDNWAGTWVFMENGTLSTKQEAEADGSATTGQESNVDAEWGNARSWAEDADDNLAGTSVSMENGTLSTKQEAEADGSATTGQESNVDAEWGYARSWAEDADDNGARTYVKMENGTLSTKQEAEADGSATAVQDTYIEGDFAWAACEAENADGGVYVDNFVGGNAVLDFEGKALATDDEVRAQQLSYAEGDFINPWTIAENQYGYTFIENKVTDGTLYSASEAIATGDVAFSAQYMQATGSYIYLFMEANNTHQGLQNTFSDEFWNAWVNAEAAEEVIEPGYWMVLVWESGPLGP